VNTLSTMQYTVGTALDRAHDLGLVVEVLVEGDWVVGRVAANDGLGVVLDRDGEEHCVVRLERVSAVRVRARAPMLEEITDGRDSARTEVFNGAVPMPGPRPAPE
jgi:hypothetical protein